MSETERILTMLEKGTISADEAGMLLQAVEREADQEAAWQAQDESEMRPILEYESVGKRFQRISWLMFAAVTALFVLSLWAEWTLYRRADGRLTAGFLALWVVCACLLLAMGVTLWMALAHWLHIRILDREGKRIAISLPVPFALVDAGLWLASRLVPRERADNLVSIAAMVRATKGSLQPPEKQPICVEVHDDREHVQIYLG
jgi:hypothetical protein